MTSQSDFIVLNAISEYWLHPGGPKREPGKSLLLQHSLIQDTRYSVQNCTYIINLI